MEYHIEFDIDFKRNKDKGLLVAIEGIDGAGKTTQAELLLKELSKKHKVYKTKNPTDHKIGKLVREVLSGKIKIPPIALQFLFSADRQVQQADIFNRLKKGEIVIMDRYFWSAVVYGAIDLSGFQFEKSINRLLITQGILSMYHQFLIPDISVFLDIPISIVLKRLGNKNKEIFENEEKLKKIHKGYQWLITKFKKEFTVIDGTKPQEEITKEIISLVEKLKNKRNGRK
ncbi:MAG: dTMP kinase [bacterium]